MNQITIISTFSESSLLTPEKLLSEPVGKVLATRPDWALLVTVPDEQLPDESPCKHDSVIAVGKNHGTSKTMWAIQIAILYELTRFKHSVVPNTNKGTNTGTYYLKLTFSGATKDNFPAWRLWRNAGLYEAVTAGPIKSDHRPEELGLKGAGKAQKNARKIALAHAETAARECAPSLFYVKAYLENLKRLFETFDCLNSEVAQ